MSLGGGYGCGENPYLPEKPQEKPPEELLAKMFKDDLGVYVSPQALRIFIRWRWDRIQKAAHAIHDAA